jgi:hypothetical protein
MGYYGASRSTMDRLRERIDDSPKKFLKAIASYRKHDRFVLGGEKYKRLFRSDHTSEIQEWYQRKSFYLVCECEIDSTLFSSKLAEVVSNDYLFLEPLYRYLTELHNH